MTDPENLQEIQKLILEFEKESYLVGGYVRDHLLSRETKDFDFAVAKNPKTLAQQIAAKLHASFLALKEEREIYRVVANDGTRFDFARMKGSTIESDLSQRDFSLNAMALRLPVDERSFDPKLLIDPYQGRADIAKKEVRQISPEIYADDPLRLLRAFRIAAQLNFSLAEETFNAIHKNGCKINQAAAERIREEILLILDCPDSYAAILQLDKIGLISEIFPESDPNRGCAIEYYPGKGVWGHSLDGLRCMEWIFANLSNEFPEDCEAISNILFQKAGGAEGHPRSTLLKLGILFHDIGKAATAKIVEGRLRFFEHPDVGAQMTKKMARRLRFGSGSVSDLAILVQAHMRPGGLAHAPVLTERARYRFFRDLGISAIPLLILSLADRYTYLAETELGRKTDLHEKTVKELIRWHYQKESEKPAGTTKLIDGDILMQELKLEPGPLIGEILKSVEESQALGEIQTTEEAIACARRWLKNHAAR